MVLAKQMELGPWVCWIRILPLSYIPSLNCVCSCVYLCMCVSCACVHVCACVYCAHVCLCACVCLVCCMCVSIVYMCMCTCMCMCVTVYRVLEHSAIHVDQRSPSGIFLYCPLTCVSETGCHAWLLRVCWGRN